MHLSTHQTTTRQLVPSDYYSASGGFGEPQRRVGCFGPVCYYSTSSESQGSPKEAPASGTSQYGKPPRRRDLSWRGTLSKCVLLYGLSCSNAAVYMSLFYRDGLRPTPSTSIVRHACGLAPSSPVPRPQLPWLGIWLAQMRGSHRARSEHHSQSVSDGRLGRGWLSLSCGTPTCFTVAQGGCSR